VLFFWRWRDEQETLESRLLSLALRLGFYIAALWLAARWVRGFDIEGWPSLVAMAAIVGVVNAVIGPAAQLLGCPLSCLTLGFFALVINAAMLALAAWIAGLFDLEVRVDGFWAAFLAALVVAVVSMALNTVVGQPIRRALR